MPLQSGSGQPQQQRERRRRHHHHHHHHSSSSSSSRNTGNQQPSNTTALNPTEAEASGSGIVGGSGGLENSSGGEAVVRYSQNNGVEMNGYRRGKSQSPDVTSWVQASSSMRNGAANGQVWRLGKVFNENDEALINRKLPKELLLRIFSHLDVVSLCRCAQVSLLLKNPLRDHWIFWPPLLLLLLLAASRLWLPVHQEKARFRFSFGFREEVVALCEEKMHPFYNNYGDFFRTSCGKTAAAAGKIYVVQNDSSFKHQDYFATFKSLFAPELCEWSSFFVLS